MNKQEAVLEKIIFSNRGVIFLIFFLITAFFSYQVTGLKIDTSLEKMVPMEHEYIQNLFKHIQDMSLGNDIRIAVEAVDGDIFSKEYMETLRQISDEVFYFPGVDKSKLKSLWTANTRWIEVTEDGFRGGEVIPQTYDGSAESLEELRANILKSGEVGRLVADNFKSSIVYVPLVDTAAQGEEGRINYQEFSKLLEKNVRKKYQSPKIKIHIIGFAKKIGDLIDGALKVAIFFAIAIGITFVLLLLYSRCLTSTIVAIVCSLVAVVWQLGFMTFLGGGIDPYSMLVPFLVFAIGVSHGVQIINAVGHEAAHDVDSLQAAKLAFRHLYVPGMLALASDAIGFITLYKIEIQVIKDLAMTASIGVGIVILTNLVLLPIVMSYLGVSKATITRLKLLEQRPIKSWKFIAQFAGPKVAPVSIVVAVLLGVAGVFGAQNLKIGDLDRGAPELRPDSRYNLDVKFVADNYSVSADVLVVMIETPKGECTAYDALEAMDRFQWHMENIQGVQSTVSLTTVSKLVFTGYNEGNLKWSTLSKNQDNLNNSLRSAPSSLMNIDCSLNPVIIFLDDHKAETLDQVVGAVKQFASENDTDAVKFVLASGNAGVEAATNETISNAQNTMLILVYSVVSLLCLLTFRSLRAVICIIVPLALTSILCQALMAELGIGVKVATLPVIALGVGIGVDYGIYIYSRFESFIKEGMSLQDAYYETLKGTGRAVSFTGFTLAIGVGTWIFSDIKFQADMGVLLTFMFLWNMVGALLLLPALARFLIKPETEKKQSSKN